MPTIITRAQANIPPVPSSVGHRSLSSWTGVKVHHTGGAFSTWRAIYDWQVRNRPPAERLVDIGYSFGVANGRVTELRGWTRHPAHDHENSTIGVVLGGNYQSVLPPEEDLAALVWFCREARLRTGKQLPITGHRDTWPRSDGRYSTCPGDRLYAYLPTLRSRVDDEEEDMPYRDWPEADRKALAVDVAAAVAIRGVNRVSDGKPIPAASHWRWSVEHGRRALAELGALRGEVNGLTVLVQQALAGGPSPLTPDQFAQLLEGVKQAAREPGERIEAALAAAGDALSAADDES